MVSCFWKQSCTVMYWKIKTSVCELLASVDLQLVSCYHRKSSYRKLSQKQNATRRTQNKNTNPTTATCNKNHIVVSLPHIFNTVCPASFLQSRGPEHLCTGQRFQKSQGGIQQRDSRLGASYTSPQWCGLSRFGFFQKRLSGNKRGVK